MPICATGLLEIEGRSRRKEPYGRRMTSDRLSERPDQRQEAREDREASALQPAWRADADQLPHEQAEIEAAGVN
jgi:hypothetical protein